jgi:poly(3-hydroxybutyrate) depolymerase
MNRRNPGPGRCAATIAVLGSIALLAGAVLADAGGWGGCDLGDVRIEADFPMARADGCFRQAPDQVAVLVMPEAAEIIPAAWYAFRVVADRERELKVQLVYGTAGHRYRPRVSDDGVAWRYLDDRRVVVSPDGTALLQLAVGPRPLWVAGQELWPSERHQSWLDRWRGRPDITVSRLGWSGQRRPIGMLRTDVGATRPQTVVFIGRQHPPEVSGAFAFEAFVETVLDDSELSRRFRATHRVVAVPEVNPDGVEMGYWRHNAGGADINRDWGPFTQPETRLMRDLLAGIERDPTTRLTVFLDFHATGHDVFYTQKDEQPVTPPLFEMRWLGRLQERMPGYAVNRSPGYKPGNPTAKTWVYETYGVPSVTFESGRDTPRDLVARLGVESARAMMETLLGEEARAATTPKDALPPGDGSFTFDGWAGPPICVWYHLPEAIGPATPVLFVMHGVNRDADRYRDEWSALADQHGFVLVVPEFNEASFPGSAGYNLGNILDRDGRPVPRERWSFSALEPLFDRVRALTGTRVERYDLYGHSAGAQFVHRYVMFMPDARVRRAVAANAGWYTLPDRDVTYPYGLAGQRLPPVDLRRLFHQPLTILLATADNDPAYPNLRRTPEAMAQGPHRLARGEFFFGSAAAAAAALGTDFRWTLEKVDGVGHDNGAMAAPAAALLDD